MKGYEKWDDYEIGKIPFVNKHRHNAQRRDFVEFIKSVGAKSVLEVGAGELIEYQLIKELDMNIDYTMVDVSDKFLDNCKFRYPEVVRIRDSFDRFVVKDKRDVSYGSSILEHSENVEKTIKTILASSDRFYFAMFKWRYDGGLKSVYHKPRKYWTTAFNIYKLLDVVKKYGFIDSVYVLTYDSKRVVFEDYERKAGMIRNGDRLCFYGRCR